MFGNVIGNACYFLLLQCLRDVDEVGCPPLLHRLVEIAYRAHVEDVLPSVVFLKYFEHLVLLYDVAQPRGVVGRRNTQQQTVIIAFEAKQSQLRGIGEHGAIVVILVSIKVVVGGIECPDAAQELHLWHIAHRLEHADSLFGGGFVAAQRQMSIHDFLHSSADFVGINIGHRVSEVQIAVITVRHGYVYHHLTT